MIKNTPGIEYQCGCAGMRSKVVGNHGMFGAYPAWPDRASYAHGTNVKELIEAGKPLVHESGDPVEPDLATRIEAESLNLNVVAPFVTPEQLGEYDIVIHPISGAQALGDPIERDPETVREELDQGWTRPRIAADVYGVIATNGTKSSSADSSVGRGPSPDWAVDTAGTAKKRDEIRAARQRRGVPFKAWWKQERQKVQSGEGMAAAVKNMWRTSMELSPTYAAELRAFWQLPEDFTYQP
jgi:hypothetical protein